MEHGFYSNSRKNEVITGCAPVFMEVNTGKVNDDAQQAGDGDAEEAV
jgi:hypothetical protein